MSADETERLIKMEEVLHGRVIGQEEAVSAISRAIRRARVGLKNPNRSVRAGGGQVRGGSRRGVCVRVCACVCGGKLWCLGVGWEGRKGQHPVPVLSRSCRWAHRIT